MRYSIILFSAIVLDEVVGRYLGAELDWDVWYNCVGVKSNFLFFFFYFRWTFVLAQTSQC